MLRTSVQLAGASVGADDAVKAASSGDESRRRTQIKARKQDAADHGLPVPGRTTLAGGGDQTLKRDGPT